MPESMNSAAETPPTETGESLDTPQSPQSQIEEIAALLREDETPQAESESQAEVQDGTPGEGQDEGKPKTLTDVAKRLGVDVAELYGIEFELGSGEDRTRTLGQLKDLAADQGQFEIDRLTFEENRTKREAEILRAGAEITEILGMLPQSAIKPELIQAIAAKRQQTLDREEQATLRVIDRWNDESVRDSDQAAMREHLSAYGYPANYLDTITDHRTRKYILDNMQRQQRIERALKQVKVARKPGHAPSAKAGSSKPPAQGASTRTVDSQVAAVSELLKTG